MPAKPFEFTSDRLRMLGPVLTEEIVALARERIVSGESFFHNDALRDGLERGGVKLALILTLEINPREYLDANEQALLRGISRKTYTANRELLVT